MTTPVGAFHGDAGLQPERTILSWDRTLLLLVTAAAFSLRWLGHHGVYVLLLFSAAILAALLIWLGQRRRYRRGSDGITQERVRISLGGVLGLTIACAVLGLLGLVIMLILPT